MKNRSHRLSISEAHEDWVDGSWTVDCVCGVNFDDGEEMVNCDECGVWVHTRCSRYVKSEKSFACDKCKSRKTVSTGVGDDSEETEVAEFLVELPTKTLRMSNPNPASASSRKPARLWTDIPMEERVHVQGVPGGDPGLFSGMKMLSIFGPELWKATGYVPKKFNFQYSEFPCSSDGVAEEKKEDFITNRSEEDAKVRSEEDANQGDKNAGVLFSLSKEGGNTLSTPTVEPVGIKSPEGGDCYEKVAPRQKKKSDNGNPDFICSEDNLNDERSVQPILLHCGKRKKETVDASNDQSAKKKARSNEKEGDLKKRLAHASRQDGGLKVNNGIQCGRDVIGDQQSYGLGECATNLESNGEGVDTSLGNDASSGGILKKGNQEDHVPIRSLSLSGSGNKGSDLNSGSPSLKEEVQDILQSCQDIGVGISSHSKDSVLISAKPASQRQESSDCVISENCKVVISSVSEAGDHRADAGNKKLNVAITKTDQSDDSLCNPYQSKREPTGLDGSVGARKRSSEPALTSDVAKDMLKTSDAVSINSRPYQRKVVVSVGKATTAASNLSKFSDNHLSPTAQNTIVSKKKDLTESTAETTKDNSANDSERDVGKCGRPRKFVKESSRLYSTSETSQSIKPQNLDSKKLSSDSKEVTNHSSSKVPLASKVKASPGSEECSHPPQADGTTNLQSKAAGSSVPTKSDRICHSGNHPSSRGNLASVAAPSCSNVPAALSDEELAFLLHQELNSSPRVPRVPRMRHAGSLPQIASPTATSMLMKRTSSIGGKDHGMSSRRKVKEFSRDVSHRSQERDDEAKKMDRKPSSPKSRRRDAGCSLDRLSRREMNGGSDKGVHSMTMRKVSSSLSSSSDANGRNVSSNHPSYRNSSDDDPQMLGHPTNRTLPGLIAEIMSEGKRMTYEELCNAVLPHWPHLRKHNGERYAYSSHSQAVLDCLRNRSEWARLVDRGPKTSGSRKRRKLDTDSMSIDSEDNEDSRDKDPESKSFESQQEEFPKGKRKARTRGRLALPGRGIVRRRRRADVVSDDESESFSNSSEDSMSSEEEIQGGGTSIVGNEASASSEEVR
ncbi:hypothetical protein F511_19564 [Dorcoceras hygrometricum]|uniref:Zinc finger PHD-type domain-containing protein n=1 Tax=Dorcoceras hygrometricum TaxID=472368 RepID=A0A2Z7ASP8_9LAMI|nr:hypothetical protein F511_19564 [Dorcoceras hygrometricum]